LDVFSPRLAEHLGSSITGDALADYVVRNMGYVAAEASARSAHVRLRPAIAAPGALRAFLWWLRDQPLERVLLSTAEEGWRYELMSTPHAMRRLTAVALARRAA
jgi:hypothetical protein